MLVCALVAAKVMRLCRPQKVVTVLRLGAKIVEASTDLPGTC